MMTPVDLIHDLRSRINPAYAGQLGTESYERKLCADALEAQQQRIAELEVKLEAAQVDAECFRFWVSEAARSPSAMAMLIMECTSEQEYRDAIMPCVLGEKSATGAAMAQPQETRGEDDE